MFPPLCTLSIPHPSFSLLPMAPRGGFGLSLRGVKRRVSRCLYFSGCTEQSCGFCCWLCEVSERSLCLSRCSRRREDAVPTAHGHGARHGGAAEPAHQGEGQAAHAEPAHQQGGCPLLPSPRVLSYLHLLTGVLGKMTQEKLTDAIGQKD